MEFKNYNANPKGWKREPDCVVRAISTATHASWGKTYKDLCELGLKKCMMPNSKLLYEAYLKKIGWEKYKMPKKSNGKRFTIKEYVDLNPNFTGIISVANHLTYVENGVLIDTWNCSNKSMGNYWKEYE